MDKWKVKTERPEEIYSSPKEYFTPEIVEKYSSTKAVKREQQRIAMILEELLEMKPPANILDLGCGPGFSMECFQRKGYNVVGVDIVKEMVEKAVKKGLNALLVDMRNLGSCFKENSFDYIISISAIQWITKSKKDIKALVEGMYHILKHQGKFGIQFYPKSSEELEILEKLLRKNFKVKVLIEKPESVKKRRFYVLGERIPL